jgi:hypothetical protein
LTASSCKWAILLLLGSLFIISGCAARRELSDEHLRMPWAGDESADGDRIRVGWAGGKKKKDRVQVYWAGPKIAVLPVSNVSAAPAPLKELESLLSQSLAKRGAVVLKKEILEEFMARRRIRYTGGLDTATAEAMKDETGVEAVLISTLEFFHEGDPPKISLHARLVSTEQIPEILWMDSVCMAGDDSPGFLGLGVIYDPLDLMETTTHRLSTSMMLHLAGRKQKKSNDGPGREIPPTVAYRSPVMESRDRLTVAVMPFLNLSERPYAWEILPLHFVERMIATPGFRVLEPGVVRRGLLNSRVMVQGGLSLPHLELVLRSTKADLVLTGTVMRYLDSRFPMVEPEVEFSVQLYERLSKEIAWSSRSVGKGTDGVYFFDIGKRSTACKLAGDLTQATVVEMTKKKNEPMTATTKEEMAP